jgi:hypothetical protein
MMGCLWITGFALVAGGLMDGWDGMSAVVSGLLILGLAWEMSGFGSRNHSIDTSVRNRIVAEDGNGRYLVKAKTSRQIIGPRRYVQSNLPAHLTCVKKGLWIVDKNTSVMQPEEQERIVWKPVTRNLSIEPRGNQSRNYLDDIMNGYDHNYIKDNDHE